MKLKMQVEDENGEVIYLKMKVGRRAEENNSVYVRWFQKDYCAKHILDFHSYHPHRMKDNVVTEFINSALKISSGRYRKAVLRDVRKTLRNSNYPNGYIDKKVTSVLRELKPTQWRKKKRYVAFPYYPSALNFASRSIRRMDVKDVSLAPSIISNNAKSVYANLKDKRSLGCVKNATVFVRCKDCDFYATVHTGHRDVNRTLAAYLNDAESKARKHCDLFNHVIGMNIRRADIIQHKNDSDLELAKFIIR